jgi:hypothetical protein
VVLAADDFFMEDVSINTLGDGDRSFEDDGHYAAAGGGSDDHESKDLKRSRPKRGSRGSSTTSEARGRAKRGDKEKDNDDDNSSREGPGPSSTRRKKRSKLSVKSLTEAQRVERR